MDATAPFTRTSASSGGLSREEAARRLEAGLGNVEPPAGETTRQVIRRNALTFFNVVLFVLISALIVVGEIRDGLFVGAVTATNVVVATVQELVAVRRLRALRALTAPTATVLRDGIEEAIPAEEVVQGDLLVLRRGDQVVADGAIRDGSVEVDESLLTGESNTVRRGPGEVLWSGVFCVASECRYEASRVGADAYAQRLSVRTRALIRRATPLMVRFDRLLRILLISTGALAAVLFIQFNVQDRGFTESLRATTATVTTIVPVGLLLGITVVTAVGAVRVSRSGAVVQDMYAVEALNYVDVIAFDKTGTLTSNRLLLDHVLWADGREESAWLAAYAAATRDEGAVNAALWKAHQARERSGDVVHRDATAHDVTGHVAFNSARRWSAVSLVRGGRERTFVLGAPETLFEAAHAADELRRQYADLARRGFRGLAFAEADRLPDADRPLHGLTVLALLAFRDELRPEVREAFELMGRLQITPKVISGDHPGTVVGILAQLGIEGGESVSGDALEQLDERAFRDVVERTTVFGRISPSLKARIIEALKANGHFVVMVGDGANDVAALQEADVAVAMASGTAMARGVSGVVLLGDSFTALIRGTREATFVLGNSGRLAKLFVAKSVYTYVLILATNLLGLEFPFLPRQGGVVSTLSLGIPALLVALSTPPANSTRDFTMRIVRFALPAGIALGICAMSLQFVVEGLLNRSVDESRTLVSLTITVVGLAFFVQVLGLEDATGRIPWRALLVIVLALLLLSALVATVRTEWTRDFFEFAPVSSIGWTAVAVASVAALLGQHLLTHHWRRVVDILTARPSEEERPRGRAL